MDSPYHATVVALMWCKTTALLRPVRGHFPGLDEMRLGAGSIR
ncbi:MAG: hypothetical protein Q8L02_08365 [Candidatus Nitrotoga sp.]|nr:hypothetical protein [Candidatus Nitrotoga sp.]